MTPEPLNLNDVVTAAEIQGVLWIDDLFDPREGDRAEIELRQLLADMKARGIAPTGPALPACSADDEVDDWFESIRAASELAIDNAIEAVRKQLAALEPSYLDYTDETVQKLKLAFGVPVTTVGYSDWKTAFQNANEANTRTLVLIDREFTSQGAGEAQGHLILQDVLANRIEGSTIVMLTHSVTTQAAADDLRQTLGRELEVDVKDFAVMSKAAFETPDVVVDSLRRSIRIVFTHRTCHALIVKIQEVMAADIESSGKILVDQSVYDLDQVVFQNSLNEGASELDVLSRILLLRQRVAVDTKLAANEEYFTLLTKLRALRELPGEFKAYKSAENSVLQAWRRDEVFDPGERINPAHAPLSCGDLFESDSKSSLYVLLAQPCDIAVRGDSSRRLNEAVFVRIEALTGPVTGEVKGSQDQRFFDVPALTGDGMWRLDFRRWGSVNLRALDLAVYNGNGALRLTKDTTVPVFLLPGWKRRFEKARKGLESGNAANVPADLKILSLSDQISGSTATVGAGSVSFSYRRIGRIRSSLALAAYASFASYHARSAFEDDFTKGLSDDEPVKQEPK